MFPFKPRVAPSTPVKQQSAFTSANIPNVKIRTQIDEGSFYRIYLTENDTVLRIAKRRGNSSTEVQILETITSKYINKMFRWWIVDGFLYFEMEYCKEGNLREFIRKECEKKQEIKIYSENKAVDKSDVNESESNSSIKQVIPEIDSDINSLPKKELESVQKSSKNKDILSKSYEGSELHSEPIHKKKQKTENRNFNDGLTIDKSTLEFLNKEAIMKSFQNSGTLLGDPEHSKKRKSAECDQPSPSNSSLIFDPFTDEYCLVETNGSTICTDSESESSDHCQRSSFIKVPIWTTLMMHHISSALHTLHMHGYIHMDVKPSNILISGQTFKLCDLNISKIGEGEVDLDGDGLYIAPEVLRNKCFFTSDVYSLGLIYLEICNPDKPLPGSGDDYRNLRLNRFKGWRIDEICRRMLERNPRRRVSSKYVMDYFESLL